MSLGIPALVQTLELQKRARSYEVMLHRCEEYEMKCRRR